MTYIRIYFLTFLMAALYTFFVSSIHLMDGGLIGLTLIIHYLSQLNIGTIYFVMNIPVLIWTYKVDKILFKRSLIGMMSFSLNMTMLSGVPNPFHLNLYVSLVIGAILLGLCFYVMSSLNASFGGISPIGVKLNEWKIMKLSYFYWITDIAVLILGLGFFGWESFYLSSLFVTIQAASLEVFSKLIPKMNEYVEDVVISNRNLTKQT